MLCDSRFNIRRQSMRQLVELIYYRNSYCEAKILGSLCLLNTTQNESNTLRDSWKTECRRKQWRAKLEFDFVKILSFLITAHKACVHASLHTREIQMCYITPNSKRQLVTPNHVLNCSKYCSTRSDMFVRLTNSEALGFKSNAKSLRNGSGGHVQLVECKFDVIWSGRGPSAFDNAPSC